MRKIICLMFLGLVLSSAGFSQNYTIQTVAGGAIPQNVQANAASFGSTVTGVALDAAGNLYISVPQYFIVVRMSAATGALTLIAGNGTSGYSGDNGPAISAQLTVPGAIAVDTSGNVYFADGGFGSSLIRKVSNGVITTVAVNTGGATLNARGLAADSSGNLYIADWSNAVVRKVSNGVTTVVAGTGCPACTGPPSGPATSVAMQPSGVAVDGADNVYIDDSSYRQRILQLTNGSVTILAQPVPSNGVGVNAAGDVYIVGLFRILKLSGGVVTTIGGNGNFGYSGDNGPATSASLGDPAGPIAVDAAGNVYFADTSNGVVRKIAGGIITTVAGGPLASIGDHGPATSAQLAGPAGVALDSSGNLYIADTFLNRIREVVNGVITTEAGTGISAYSGDNGPAQSAQLSQPGGVAVDTAGNVYIADPSNNVVRKVSNGIITTVAGIAGRGPFSGDNGPATSAQLNGPTSVAVDSAGNLYIADSENGRVREVSNGVITTIAGGGTSFGDNGPATSAQLGPAGVALDSSGNLYIADSGHNVIRMVSGGIITTVAGNATAGFSGDNGPAISAQLNIPLGGGVAVDTTGNLYIADTNNYRIRKVSKGVITTIAGDGYSGISGDNGPALSATLTQPLGVAADTLGRIFIADSGNNRIRMLTPPCSFILTTSSIQATPVGGSFNIAVQTPAYCSWSVSGLPAWITATVPVSVTGPANITLVVASDPGASRNVAINIAGISVAVSQVVCSYAISPGGQSFTTAGGSGTVTVTAPAGCAWSSANTVPFVSFSGASTGSGNGAVGFLVSANAGGELSGTFTVAGLPFTVDQESATLAGLNFIGSMPHIAAEENWTTTFTLVNKGAASATARLSLFGDAVDATGNGPLMVPLAFPQQPAASGPLLAASIDQTIAPSASLIVTTAGPQTPPVLVGSAQLAATGAVDGFAIFHQIQTAQEAVVPMETRNASSYLLAFDNTGGVVLGVAVENVSAQNAVIQVIIRDDAGNVISTPGTTISLSGNGHTSFVLSDPALGFPVTANKRGTIEFDTPAGGRISVLGIRFTPPNNALTTIPALANVGTGGGSIAHLASGGDGWQTTFVLVNTGTSSAEAALSFFSDMTGAPLLLPLSFPQGNGTATTASSVSQTLAAGATLLVVSSGAPQLLIGSAQLSTTGHISGFVIFRHNGQEAVVPMESRNASAYILAFDNTNGAFTGVAVNAVSTQQVNIPVVVRDDTGAQIATDAITLAANGHYAFTLVTDKYPATANIRGTIEFDTPTGAQIGALGIRIPASAAHTYTTLPALAK